VGQDTPGDDPYEILGVAAGASRQEIVRAYHRAAQGAHPDAQPADPQAAARFRALTAAYELLSDPRRRAAYDRRRAAPVRARPARPEDPAGPSDLATPAHSHHLHGRPVAVRLSLPWPAPPLWAGPVHVEPPRGGPAVTGLAPWWADELAAPPGLAGWYSGYIGSQWP